MFRFPRQARCFGSSIFSRALRCLPASWAVRRGFRLPVCHVPRRRYGQHERTRAEGGRGPVPASNPGVPMAMPGSAGRDSAATRSRRVAEADSSPTAPAPGRRRLLPAATGPCTAPWGGPSTGAGSPRADQSGPPLDGTRHRANSTPAGDARTGSGNPDAAPSADGDAGPPGDTRPTRRRRGVAPRGRPAARSRLPHP
jgi:hypothetical protein